MTLNQNGDSLVAGDVYIKNFSVKNVIFYVDLTNSYLYWTDGSFEVNGVSFSLSAGNSGASAADKVIVATLTEGANTAAISLSSTSSQISTYNTIVIGYVNSSNYLSLRDMNQRYEVVGSGSISLPSSGNTTTNNVSTDFRKFKKVLIWWSGTTSNSGASSATGSVVVNGVTLASITHTGGTSSSLTTGGWIVLWNNGTSIYYGDGFSINDSARTSTPIAGTTAYAASYNISFSRQNTAASLGNAGVTDYLVLGYYA